MSLNPGLSLHFLGEFSTTELQTAPASLQKFVTRLVFMGFVALHIRKHFQWESYRPNKLFFFFFLSF